MIHELYIQNVKLQIISHIKRYAVQNKMNQLDMAYLLQTTQPRISRMFKGHTEGFSIDILLAWAYNLGINFELKLNKGEVK